MQQRRQAIKASAGFKAFLDTLGEAGEQKAPSRDSPRMAACCPEKLLCASSAELLREATARGLHSSSVGGDPTCTAHSM